MATPLYTPLTARLIRHTDRSKIINVIFVVGNTFYAVALGPYIHGNPCEFMCDLLTQFILGTTSWQWHKYQNSAQLITSARGPPKPNLVQIHPLWASGQMGEI